MGSSNGKMDPKFMGYIQSNNTERSEDVLESERFAQKDGVKKSSKIH